MVPEYKKWDAFTLHPNVGTLEGPKDERFQRAPSRAHISAAVFFEISKVSHWTSSRSYAKWIMWLVWFLTVGVFVVVWLRKTQPARLGLSGGLACEFHATKRMRPPCKAYFEFGGEGDGESIGSRRDAEKTRRQRTEGGGHGLTLGRPRRMVRA